MASEKSDGTTMTRTALGEMLRSVPSQIMQAMAEQERIVREYREYRSMMYQQMESMVLDALPTRVVLTAEDSERQYDQNRVDAVRFEYNYRLMPIAQAREMLLGIDEGLIEQLRQEVQEEMLRGTGLMAHIMAMCTPGRHQLTGSFTGPESVPMAVDPGIPVPNWPTRVPVEVENE